MTPAESARISAGLSVEQAARRARVCPQYLRAVERRGGASYGLAMRLAAIYGVSANVFVYSNKGSETPATKRRARAIASVARALSD